MSTVRYVKEVFLFLTGSYLMKWVETSWAVRMNICRSTIILIDSRKPLSARNMSIEENCSFVVDNVLKGDAEGRVQVVEELLVEDKRNKKKKKNVSKSLGDIHEQTVFVTAGVPKRSNVTIGR